MQEPTELSSTENDLHDITKGKTIPNNSNTKQEPISACRKQVTARNEDKDKAKQSAEKSGYGHCSEEESYYVVWKRQVTRALVSVTAILVAVVVFILIMDQKHFNVSENKHFKSKSKPSLEKETTVSNQTLKTDKAQEVICTLPKLEAYNEEVKPYLKKFSKISCPLENTKLFKIGHNRTLIVLRNTTQYGFLNCCYVQLSRQTDAKTKASKTCHNIDKPETIIDPRFDFIGVKCMNKTLQPQFVDAFPVVRVKQPKKKSPTKSRRDKINVVILGVDATSHLNFQRIMTKSLEYLKQNLSAVGLQWLNNHGENTLPNMITVLTGYNLTEIKNRCLPDQHTSHFDSCPFIWKYFAHEGYLTTYAEDLAGISTFGYMKQGFDKKPTDYYLRPLTVFQERTKSLRSNFIAGLPQCFGPHKSSKVMLDYMKQLTQTLEENAQNYFQVFWTMSITHSSLTDGAQIDDSILAVLKWFNDRNYLNNTVFVLMSDHGFRFGGYRNTYAGDIESKMPFAYFTFPTWFKHKFSAAIKNFETNANHRLTTFFDFYRTIKDLRNLDLYISNSKIRNRTEHLVNSTLVPRSISLFLPVPKSRTCLSAGIPEQYCICNALPRIKNLKHPLLQSSAKYLMKKVNQVVSGAHQCSKLDFEGIITAKGVLDSYNNSSSMMSDRKFLHKITIRTTPGNATYEATLVNKNANIHKSEGDPYNQNIKNDVSDPLVEWEIIGQVTRTNAYKNQSYCVKDEALKSFCQCKI